MRQIQLAAAMVAALAVAPAWAHSEHDAAAKEPQQKEPVADIPAKRAQQPDARAYFTDTELVTQDGKKVRFYSDVLEGRVVLINVIYTNCKDACPLITQKLNEVRAQLGDQFGTQVYFVTITSDPVRDTPKALKDFAKKQNANPPGWIYLTGQKKNVDAVLKKLGQFSQHVEEHSTLLIAGNVPEKRWSKIRPDAPSLSISERLKLLAESGSSVPSILGR
jgi:cytochrome oxidase Cu insertion factor (SCO1/SenC/PrrC family)